MVTLNVAKDTYVDKNYPSTNYGTDSDMRVRGADTQSQCQIMLVEFDTASIPSGSTINSATLYIYNDGTGGSDEKAYYFNRCMSQFVETTVTYNTRPSYTATNRATTLITGNSAGWESVSIIDLFQDAIDAEQSYLAIYVHGTDLYGNVKCYTREYSSSYDAYISVDYTEAPTQIMKINIGDSWKTVNAVKINIGDSWKDVVGIQQNIGDIWKTVL